MKPIRGFSLMELMVVVIIISVLAGLSLAYGIKPIESAKAKGARAMLDAIYTAEKEFCMHNGSYGNLGAPLNPGTLVGEFYIDNPNDPDQRDWAYSNDPLGASTGPNDCGTFTINATRAGGPNNVEYISIDQDGVIGGNFTP